MKFFFQMETLSLFHRSVRSYVRNAGCDLEDVFRRSPSLVRPSAGVHSAVSPGLDMEQGNCTTFFLSLAIFLDIVGLLLFFIGVFAPLSYWDFFVFSGPLLIFLSLVLWIFWYTGNLTVSEEELNLPKADIL